MGKDGQTEYTFKIYVIQVVVFLPVIAVHLYRVFKRFKTLKYLIMRETICKQHLELRSLNFCFSTTIACSMPYLDTRCCDKRKRATTGEAMELSALEDNELLVIRLFT